VHDQTTDRPIDRLPRQAPLSNTVRGYRRAVLLDFFIPDAIPFADETLLALGAALLGSWKKRKDKDSPNEASGH
jgi:hypothetical protein